MKNQLKPWLRAALLIYLVGLSGAQKAWADPSPVEVAPSDSSVHLVGRFDTQDPAGPRCAWSGSEISIHFQGTGVDVKILDDKRHLDYFQVVVDGVPTTVIPAAKDQTVYHAASDLPDREHTVQIIKRTEAKLGQVQFLGFEIASGGKPLPWTAVAKHRMEIIGDSITCGFGDETNSKADPFTPATENNYLTYEALTARRFGAEYTCIAWSGYKMYPDKTIPSIWDLNLPPQPDSKADLSKWKPEVIVINLGTNDYWDAVPDSSTWVKAYEAFLTTLRTAYPDADVFLTNSVMLIPDRDGKLVGSLQQIVQDETAAGDKKVHLVRFDREDPVAGMGSADHPNLKTHAIMADVLSGAIAKELGWTYVDGTASASTP
ncbi:MAG TPA: SGNH/GDSL hydrolase family protein [Candidatus Methylacidiphilales bacterium]